MALPAEAERSGMKRAAARNGRTRAPGFFHAPGLMTFRGARGGRCSRRDATPAEAYLMSLCVTNVAGGEVAAVLSRDHADNGPEDP